MANTQEATKITQRCGDMRSWWSPRDKKFKVWYKLIQMQDQLAQDKMESFVGNDPRAAFNITVGMLDAKIPHRVRPEQLEQSNFASAADIKNAYSLFWRKVNESHRLGGRQSWMSDFLGYLIATGWYSVFANISGDGKTLQAEIWNPAEVYQVYDGQLVEVCRITLLQPDSVKRMLASNNWKIDGPISQPMELYDYWKMDDSLQFPMNSVVIGNHLVKPMTDEKRFPRIPIFTAPTGGLPDSGAISGNSTKWRGELGQASIATNEQMIKQTNRWWAFMMQIVRDTAQPITYEKTAGGAVILRPDDKFKRGLHLKMGLQDDFGFVTPSPVPVELRGMQLDMEAMMEKGGVPKALFGTPQGRVTASVMAQMTQAAHTLAKPFHTATVDCLSDIDNFWLKMWRKNNYKPYGVEFPTELSEEIEMTADYEIRIPGDAANRATFARMLNPNFTMSQRRIYDEFFPEVENPIEEMAIARGEEALNHPTHKMAQLIQSYHEMASQLKQAGDAQGAALYLSMAEMAQAQIQQMISGGQPPPQQGLLSGGQQ